MRPVERSVRPRLRSRAARAGLLALLGVFVFVFGADSARAQCTDLTETYYGHWFNDSFLSYGPLALTVDIQGSVASFVVDVDGNAFGSADPGPVMFGGSVSGDTVTIAATGVAVYGDLNGTIVCSTGAINVTLSMIPMVSFDDVVVTGSIANDVISASYSIILMGMGFGGGTMVASLPGMPSSNFETDAELWRDVDNNNGNASRPASGGNPGGFLQITEAEGMFGFMDFKALAPGKFLGDLSSFDGGTFAFDAMAVPNGGSPSKASFATVQILGTAAAGNAILDFDTGLPPSDTWTTYSMPFDATTWGVPQMTWDAILADVRQITITLEPGTPLGAAGLDDVTLAPEPGAALGAAASLGMLAGLGARRGRRARRSGRGA